MDPDRLRHSDPKFYFDPNTSFYCVMPLSTVQYLSTFIQFFYLKMSFLKKFLF